MVRVSVNEDCVMHLNKSETLVLLSKQGLDATFLTSVVDDMSEGCWMWM